MSKEELEQLLGVAMGFAKQMIASHREFHPFGARIDSDGTIGLVGIRTGEEFPVAAPMVDDLQGAFQSLAAEGGIRAAVACFFAEVVLQGNPAKQTAAVFRLAHTSGRVAEVVLPFSVSPNGVPTCRLGSFSSSPALP